MKLKSVKILVCLGVIGAIVATGSEEASWGSFQPPPDSRYDWIQLTSGEWLKGELKAMHNSRLEFDSNKVKLQNFKFSDIQQIRTHKQQRLLVEEKRRNLQINTGYLVMNGNQVSLNHEGEVVEIDRNDVVSIAGLADRRRDNWEGSVSAGINMRGGNTETTDLTIMADVTRRTAQTRFNFDFLGNYSKAKDTETANNQRINGDLDIFLTSRTFLKIVALEYFRDPFSNIADQYSVYTGVGNEFIKTSKTEWTLGAGVGYQESRFVSVEAGADKDAGTPFLTAGTAYDYELTSNMDFLLDYSFRLLDSSNGQFTHHMLSRVSIDVISDLDLDVSFIWDRIAKPQAASDGTVPEQDDYQLIFSLAYDF